MDWAPEATPQTETQVRRAPRCPEVVEAATERGITSIVHFTRARPGLVGILDSSAIRSRRDLPEVDRLKYVYEENAADRDRDLAWHSYVNLSVTKINGRMFNSSKKWHPDAEWVILEFHPEVLGDPGLVFCTTNNAYEEVVHRCKGLQGFEQMFAPQVPWGYHGRISIRRGQEPNLTTDPQAEILYPFALPLDHLHTITVSDDATHDTVAGTLFNLRSELPHYPRIIPRPEAFR